MKKTITILLSILLAFGAQAQEQKKTNILFLIDASFSMRKSWETKSKWTIAKETVVEVADSLKANLEGEVNFGIRVYGHQSLSVAQDCKDTELLVPIGENSIAILKSRLESISPKGITPLAFSLEETKKDFEVLEGKNILILITDGAESCQGDPCYILKLLMENEVILKPFIIGLNIDIESLQAYDCLGGEAGQIFNEKSQKNFKARLYNSLSKAITYTSLQINLVNAKNEPIITDKVMNFYSEKDNELKYTFYHKQDENGVSDTLYIVPDTYKVIVKTIPETTSKSFALDAVKHNIVNIKTPTGDLKIDFVDSNGKIYSMVNALKYVIKKQNEHTYLHQALLGDRQTYLVGKYDIDILTLPPVQLIDQEIKGDILNAVKIPAPGKLSLRSALPIHGALFVKNVDSLINIYSLKPKTTQEILDLQPGNYELVYRLSSERKMIKTKTVSFTIKSLQTTKLDL